MLFFYLLDWKYFSLRKLLHSHAQKRLYNKNQYVHSLFNVSNYNSCTPIQFGHEYLCTTLRKCRFGHKLRMPPSQILDSVPKVLLMVTTDLMLLYSRMTLTNLTQITTSENYPKCKLNSRKHSFIKIPTLYKNQLEPLSITCAKFNSMINPRKENPLEYMDPNQWHQKKSPRSIYPLTKIVQWCT